MATKVSLQSSEIRRIRKMKKIPNNFAFRNYYPLLPTTEPVKLRRIRWMQRVAHVTIRVQTNSVRKT